MTLNQKDAVSWLLEEADRLLNTTKEDRANLGEIIKAAYRTGVAAGLKAGFDEAKEAIAKQVDRMAFSGVSKVEPPSKIVSRVRNGMTLVDTLVRGGDFPFEEVLRDPPRHTSCFRDERIANKEFSVDSVDDMDRVMMTLCREWYREREPLDGVYYWKDGRAHIAKATVTPTGLFRVKF